MIGTGIFALDMHFMGGLMRGSVTCIVGPNESGKTTFLKQIADFATRSGESVGFFRSDEYERSFGVLKPYDLVIFDDIDRDIKSASDLIQAHDRSVVIVSCTTKPSLKRRVDKRPRIADMPANFPNTDNVIGLFRPEQWGFEGLSEVILLKAKTTQTIHMVFKPGDGFLNICPEADRVWGNLRIVPPEDPTCSLN